MSGGCVPAFPLARDNEETGTNLGGFGGYPPTLPCAYPKFPQGYQFVGRTPSDQGILVFEKYGGKFSLERNRLFAFKLRDK
jgi:hypothetical protein